MNTDFTAIARARRLSALAKIQSRQGDQFGIPGATSLPKVSCRQMQTMFQWRSSRSAALQM